MWPEDKIHPFSGGGGGRGLERKEVSAKYHIAIILDIG